VASGVTVRLFSHRSARLSAPKNGGLCRSFPRPRSPAKHEDGARRKRSNADDPDGAELNDAPKRIVAPGTKPETFTTIEHV
jgi:hypothetical protein